MAVNAEQTIKIKITKHLKIKFDAENPKWCARQMKKGTYNRYSHVHMYTYKNRHIYVHTRGSNWREDTSYFFYLFLLFLLCVIPTSTSCLYLNQVQQEQSVIKWGSTDVRRQRPLSTASPIPLAIISKNRQ